MNFGPHFNSCLMHTLDVCLSDRGVRAFCNNTSLCLLLKRTERSIKPMQNFSAAETIRSRTSALSLQSTWWRAWKIPSGCCLCPKRTTLAPYFRRSLTIWMFGWLIAIKYSPRGGFKMGPLVDSKIALGLAPFSRRNWTTWSWKETNVSIKHCF